ncbi:MAG: tetratricopeptide (TPR) repeat protein [Verrucomicrobiales bacterium]|jgi:tetratricopeptide (TPR) repeat protein
MKRHLLVFLAGCFVSGVLFAQDPTAEGPNEKAGRYPRSAQKAAVAKGHIGEAPVDERIAWVQGFLSAEYPAKNIQAKATAFANIVSAKFMTGPEILEHGDAMAEAVPRQGQAWPDLANRVEQIDKDFARSLALWERGIKEAPNLRYLQIRCQIGRANALQKLDRKDEAQVVYDAIDAKSIPQNMEKLWTDLTKAMSKN